MFNVYIAAYGSNDLYYYTRESLKRILSSLEKLNELNIYGLFSFKDIDKERVWIKYPKEQRYNIEELAFIYKNNKFNALDIRQYYYKVEEDVEVMDIGAFLEDNNINSNSNNIVIISGHGGLFQSLLDMSQVMLYSINTVHLCNILKSFNINLLILDMCSMNYVEIAYELLKDSQIENIILFQGLAPLQGVDITKILKILNHSVSIESSIEQLLLLKEYSFMLINREKVEEIEKIKVLINREYLVYLLSEGKQEFNVNKIVEELRKIVVMGEGAVSELEPLLFVSKCFNENNEQSYYKSYQFAQNNFLVEVLCDNAEKFKDLPSIIKLTDENLMHIINIHNPTFTSDKLKKVYEKYNNSLMRM